MYLTVSMYGYRGGGNGGNIATKSKDSDVIFGLADGMTSPVTYFL